jgi:hypothetical protein
VSRRPDNPDVGARPVISVLAIVVCVLAAVTTHGSAVAAPSACRPNETATVIIDGELYGMVRASGPRYVFGWSGKPVLTIDDALRLLRKLGLRGTDRQLFGLLSGGRKIPGASYGEGGSIAYFFLRCRGRYTATVVVRGGRYLPATRIWLHEERRLRAFCMDEQWLPNDARLSVTFTAPLASTAPTFAIDRNADGRIDRRGKFRRGGGSFPSPPVRC